MPFKKVPPLALRNAVWKTYVQDTTNPKCYCCGVESISTGNFECGHIISKAKGGLTNLENLRPICSLCNKSMGMKDMVQFMVDCGFDTKHVSQHLQHLQHQKELQVTPVTPKEHKGVDLKLNQRKLNWDLLPNNVILYQNRAGTGKLHCRLDCAGPKAYAVKMGASDLLAFISKEWMPVSITPTIETKKYACGLCFDISSK